MELRRMSFWLALFVIAAISQCSGMSDRLHLQTHAVQKRETNDMDDDFALADEASDDEAQNDENGDPEEEEASVNVSIVTKPTTYNVRAGDSVRLECKLDPDSVDAVVQWSGDKDKYSIASVITINDRRINLDSNDLIINNVNTSDSGSYVCAVLQKNGAAIQHNLIVMEAPKITEFSATNNGHVVEGSRLVLTCEVTGTPSPQITWSKSMTDSNGIEFNEKLTEEAGTFTHNSLTKDPVKKEDAGRYYCYAINSVGNSQKVVEVTVDGKPRVHVPRAIVNSDYNITAELQCSAHETPVPRIYWYKDGTRIENIEEYYSITTDGPTSNLTIRPRNPSDFGTYTCEARNRLGVHARAVQLVQRPVVSALRGAGATLACTVHSHAPLTHLQLALRALDADKWETSEIPIPTPNNGHEHIIKYTITDQKLAPGKYEARIKAQNTHQKWSDQDEATIVQIEEIALPIKQSAVLGAGSNGNQLYTSLMPTLLIYLLVRMF